MGVMPESRTSKAKIVQVHDMKPDGYMEAFQLMLDGIFAPKAGVPNDAAALATRVI